MKSAQEVSIEDIPLPSLPMETDAEAPSTEAAPTSILKQSVANLRKKSPPGCPQGAPPLLLEFEVTESDESDDEQDDSSGKKRIRFSDEPVPKADNENNLKEFLKEIEQLEGDKNEESNKELESAPPTVLPSIPTAAPSLQLPPRFPPPPIGNNPHMFPGPSRPLLQPAPPVSLKPLSNLPPPMPLNVIRPPHLPPPFVGPPPTRNLPVPSLALPGPGNFNTTLRVNPNVNHSLQPNQPASQPPNSAVHYQRKSDDRKSQVTTISAKPQLRNLSADATKFMPLALRLNRQGTTQKKTALSNASSVVGYGMVSQSSTATPRSTALSGKDKNNSKEDAYADFMKELSGFMQEK